MLAGAGGCVGDCWRLLVPAGDCWRVLAGGGGWWSHLLGASSDAERLMFVSLFL